MIKKLLITILILAPFSFSHAQTILFPSRGGTGIGSVTAGDIGKCLAVSNNAPFAFTLGACSGGIGSGTAVGWASTTADVNSIYFTGGSTGKVGIGTTTPVSKLHVQDTSGGFITLNSADIAITTGDDLGGLDFYSLDTSSMGGVWGRIRYEANALWDGTSGDGADLIFSTRTVSDGSLKDKMVLTAAGNVAIGTTSPDVYSTGLTRQLTVTTNAASVSSASLAIAGGTTGTARIDLGNESILRAGIQAVDGSDLRFLTNSTDSGTTLTTGMTLTSSGNLGIGTTSPGQELSVAGDILGNAIIGQYFTATSTNATSTFRGVVAVGVNQMPIQETYFGYSPTYRVLRIGTNESLRSIALNVDPLTVAGGSFSGNGQILIGNNGILAPNADGSNWMGVLRATSGKVYLGGATSAGTLTGTGLNVDSTTSYVGIGTSTPAVKLNLASVMSSNYTEMIRISETGNYGTNASGIDWYFGNEAFNGGRISVERQTTSSGFDMTFSTKQNASALSEKLRITSTGNVGIGTTSPSSRLTITGATPAITGHQMLTLYSSDTTAAVDTGGTIGFGGNYSTGGSLAGWAGIAGLKENSTDGNFSGYLSFRTRANGSNLAEAMRITSDRLVGIGTTTPYAKLSITNTGSDPSFVVEDSTSPDSSPFIIDASGNVGIGTTSPQNLLHLSGTGSITVERSDGGTGQRLALTHKIAGSDKWALSTINNSDFAVDVNAAERLRITSSGNVGIGSTSPTAKLSVVGSTYLAGTVYATSTVTLTGLTGATGGSNNALCINTAGVVLNETTGVCMVSSLKFKKDITPLNLSGINTILKLKPVEYSYKEDDNSDYKDKQYGFIAEDVASVDPHLAKYGLDGTARTLDDRAILAASIKAIQELKAEVDSLKAEVKLLKSIKK